MTAEYERRRRADIGGRMLAVDMLNRSLLSDLLPVQGLRGLGLYALDRVGILRRAVMREGVAPSAATPALMRHARDRGRDAHLNGKAAAPTCPCHDERPCNGRHLAEDAEENMGLLDVLNGMQNGPRGASPSAPSPQGKESGGMSPLMMALLGLLAYKAFKGLTGGGKPAAKAPAPAPAPTPPPARAPGGTVAAGMPAGNLNDLLKGGLGGLLAGGAAGTVLSGGLNDLLKQFQESGHGEIAKSWVGTGQNQPISPKDLGSALGADQINSLTSEFGLSRDELLEGLSQYLPQVVDHLTPGGQVPAAHEMDRLI